MKILLKQKLLVLVFCAAGFAVYSLVKIQSPLPVAADKAVNVFSKPEPASDDLNLNYETASPGKQGRVPPATPKNSKAQ